jgi:hypothetical protein
LKTYFDCLPCFLNQALRAARATTDDEAVQRRVINAVAGMIPRWSLDLKPPQIAQQAYRLIGEITGDPDPFRKAKAEANRAVLAAYPRLEQLVNQSADRLFAACRLAIAGNSIDLGPKFEYGNIDSIIDDALDGPLPLAVNHFERFWSSLRRCRRVLYLGDNAGEIVFDRLLIEEIKRACPADICFVVRERPVINDATREDALAVGIDRVARVITSGSDAPATILTQCSPELRQWYQSADLIISKGQGNYESLEDEPGNIFFFLRAKCPLVAKYLGVNLGDCVLKNSLDAQGGPREIQ